MAKTLSVVVPVYFNGPSLPELFGEMTEIENELASRGLALELIFVNDGSGDDSLSRLVAFKKVRPATKVVSLSRNFGAVAASITGLRYVTGDVFALLAADLQEPPKQLLAMVDRWLAGSKFILSVRASREDPPLTRFFAALYYRIIRSVVARGYPRGGTSLMMMDKVMLPYMLASARNTNPNMYAYWLGFEPAILEYHRRARKHGRSRWTFLRKVGFFVDTICDFSVLPIRVMSAFGVATAFVSLVYGIGIIFAALHGRVPIQGFATIVVLLSFFAGIILVMLGTLGEYLWRVFDVVANKPQAVIDEAYL